MNSQKVIKKLNQAVAKKRADLLKKAKSYARMKRLSVVSNG